MRVPAEEARMLSSEADPSWGADVAPDGMPCLETFVEDATAPGGKRHIVLAKFEGEKDMQNLALACRAHDLAETVIALEGERDEIIEALCEIAKAGNALRDFDKAQTALHIGTVFDYVERRDELNSNLTKKWKDAVEKVKRIWGNGSKELPQGDG